MDGGSAQDALKQPDSGKTETEQETKTSPEKPGETAASAGKLETSQGNESATGKDTASASRLDKKSESSSAKDKSSSEPSKSAGSKTSDPNADSDLEVCHNCNLPRLRYPRIGLTSRPPPDPNAQYCANEPPVVLAGHDVHGNAFPGFKPKPNTHAAAAAASKTTKPKPNSGKADKKAAAEAPSPTTSRSSSSENTAATPSTSFEYPQIRTPQMKCPNNCGQWKAVNVMAKHLDACLLGKGRKAGREARERLGAGTGTGTPAEGSRAGTPRPGAGNGGLKRGRMDEESAKSGNKKQKKAK